MPRQIIDIGALSKHLQGALLRRGGFGFGIRSGKEDAAEVYFVGCRLAEYERHKEMRSTKLAAFQG